MKFCIRDSLADSIGLAVCDQLSYFENLQESQRNFNRMVRMVYDTSEHIEEHNNKDCGSSANRRSAFSWKLKEVEGLKGWA